MYIINWLLSRKERKTLVYALSQVELRSLPMPGLDYLSSLFMDYYDLCKQLGFTLKYDRFNSWTPLLNLTKKHKIFKDTREKDLLKFSKVSSKVQTLNYGDYCFSNTIWTGKTYIERKSLTDFIGTLSYGFTRFEKEIKRAKQDGAYLIVLVEENLTNCLNFRGLSYLPRQIKVSPEYIFHNVRTLIQEYPNLQFLFVDSHKACAEMVETLFSYGKQVQKYDLQYLHDLKLL